MPFGNIIQRRVPSIFAGRLRQRIDIVTVSSVQDSTGGFDLNADVVYANVWASVEPLQGGDKDAAGSIVAVNTLQVVIRYIGAAPSWQPVFDYLGNTLVVDANKNLQQAQAGGGLSGATAPVWNQTAGQFTTDGDPSTGRDVEEPWACAESHGRAGTYAGLVWRTPVPNYQRTQSCGIQQNACAELRRNQ